MAALRSLRPAVGALTRNPILIVLVGLYGLVQLPQFALQQSQPLVAAAVSLGLTGLLILFVPFFQGGIISMADEALAGRTGLDAFIAAGKANYVSLLVAYLAVFAINLVFGFVAFVAGFVLVLFGGAGIASGSPELGLATLAIVAIVGLLFVLVYLIVNFAIQFYAHAIVLDDADIIAGFKRSVGLVRRNLLGVLGYTAVLIAGSLVIGGVSSVASLLLSPGPSALPLPEASLPLLVVAAVVYVGTIAVGGAFYAAYSVAFYRSISGGVAGGVGGTAGAGTPGSRL
ncbi:hypothetical protein SAMN05192561_11344 [Halopenitus malekzadehii]|uniref:DUF7847 domain-containing protein n=1 Tax=Halopenitus malekzadehii TaxID=1267564 RepID=A0A1H6JHK8_9EURY|nr:hypothetical protein [Halopenitus malekzadehii]SEH61809.1 hypothetical protein SAMN05192561_11344 [Halopenitus malekzadehii]